MRDEIYKLPKEFLAKLKVLYPNQYAAVLNTFLAKKKTAFRVNYLKTGLTDLRRKLLEKHIKFKELPFPKGAFLLKSPLRVLQNTDIYTQGLVYVQNLASMLVPLVLEPQNGEDILDLCAAPGAKTTQSASLAAEAKIVAVEKNRGRFYKLLANLKAQGAENRVRPLLIDGIWVRKKFPEYFNKILLDAPCSAEGRFFVHNPRSFKYWRPRKVKEAVNKQKQLLNAAFYALKEGGVLVYSTCTFSPEENEVMVNWFVEKFKDRMRISPIKELEKTGRPGLGSWNGKKFLSEVRLTKRIIPTDCMEAFYIAKLRKE